jgi:hypothetical protein
MGKLGSAWWKSFTSFFFIQLNIYKACELMVAIYLQGW